jgi:hypothetical protein
MANTTEEDVFAYKRRTLFASTRTALLRIALLFAVGIGAFLIGVYVTSRDVRTLKLQIDSIQSEVQKSKQELVSQRAANSAMESRLNSVLAQLEAIEPSKDTYEIAPNQSVGVADGRLTLGLVGAPNSNNLVLSVNGAQKQAASGDVIQTAVDDETCRITVQRFDLFKAVINVRCAKN